jgi:hypothetical protein
MPDPSWPAGALPDATPAEPEASGFEPCAPSEGALDLGLVRAAIEDGLLMVFGPDGDPVPPQVFGAAAAAQPDAGVRLSDGPQVSAQHIAAVLEAQTRGRLGSGESGDEPWIRAMLGIGPEPEMAETDDLLAETCTLEVVTFGRELMITSRNGATFLVADARARTPDSICLCVESAGPVAAGDLVARLLAGGEERADPRANEFAMPDCKAWLEDDAVVVDVPELGAVYLARIDDAGIPAPPASLFMASGEVATIDDLLSALRGPTSVPPAPEQSDLEAPAAATYDDARAPSPHPVPLTIGLPDACAAEPERVALVAVRGLPAGASLSAGVASGDGSWLLSPRDLPGLCLTPPPDWASDLAFEVAAIAVASPAGELTSASAAVVVPWRSGEAGPSAAFEPEPSAMVEPAPSPWAEPESSAVVEPESSAMAEPAPAWLPLDLEPQVLSDGGPFDAVIVRDLPAGVTLSGGTYDPATAVWVLLPHQLSGLCVRTSGGQPADFTLSLLGVRLQPGGARPRVLARVPVSTAP